MRNYPTYGTHPIKCGKLKCAWKGYETDLVKRISGIDRLNSYRVCPECGRADYQFMNFKEMEIWGKSNE